MRTIAIIRKEIYHIRRDIRVLYFAFAWPVMLLMLFGYTVSYDLTNIPIVFCDLDRTSVSRGLIGKFDATGLFNVKLKDRFSWEITRSVLDRGVAKAVIIIPSGFSRKLDRLEPADLQILVDGSDNNSAGVLLGYSNGIIQDFSTHNTQDEFNHHGLRAGSTPPVSLDMRFLYNPSLKSQNFTVPGLIAVIMMIIGTLLTSLTISTEWERGTMEQLMYTPVKPYELIIGKLAPYLAIGVLQMTLVLCIGIFVFGVPFKGNLLLFYLSSFLFLGGALGVGLFISLISRSQQLAAMISFLTAFLPAFMLSGFIFPISNMPLVLQGLSYLVPARYFLHIVRGLFLKGSGLDILWPEFLAMLIFALVSVIISVIRFKKRLA
ncbi:MAG TPA: ABC transporter permease [bacterium]